MCGYGAPGCGQRRDSRNSLPKNLHSRVSTSSHLLSVPIKCDMTNQQVNVGNQETHKSDRHADLEKILEGKLVTVLLGDTGAHHVGGGADQGPVASEARSKGEGPYKRLQRQIDVFALREVDDDWDHHGGEGDVVYEG